MPTRKGLGLRKTDFRLFYRKSKLQRAGVPGRGRRETARRRVISWRRNSRARGWPGERGTVAHDFPQGRTLRPHPELPRPAWSSSAI